MNGRDEPAAVQAAGGWSRGPGLAWGLAAAWTAGVALQLQQPALAGPGTRAALLLAGLLAALAAAALRRRLRTVPATLALLSAALLAHGSTAWRAGERLADALPEALEGQDLVVTGVVAQMPDLSLTGTRFVFDVESATWRGQPVAVPERVSLGWMAGWDADAWLAGPGVDLRAGDRWRLPVRLRQPHGSLNPHGFDLELWLFERGIRASGYVRSAAGGVRAQRLDSAVAHPFERARQALREALLRQVRDPAAAGVLAALAVGDQAAIERDDWDLFRVTGVAHLMSISGLHVTMFAWAFGALVRALWRRSARAALWLPAPTAARWGGLCAAAAYAMLAGWGVPAQRTVWMIATVVVLRTLGLRWPLPAVLAAAAGVVIAVDPWALLQPGFWLSFAAVALLVAAEPVTRDAPPAEGWRARATAAAGAALRTQAVATVALAPLSLLFFQQVSVVGFVANLFAIPLVTLLITPLALLGALAPPLWSAGAWAVQALAQALGMLAGGPLSVFNAAAAPAWAAVAGVAGGALLVLPLPWRLRLAGLPLLLPLLAPPVERPGPGRFELVAADVGQGTAVLVRTAGHLLVYDTGPQYTPEADAGARVLLPLLRARGETKVDLLVLSHRDSDHVGGAASLLAGVPVRQMSTSLADEHPLRRRGVPHQPCAAGQSWQWDGVRFEVLHPPPGPAPAGAKPNAQSCVLRVQGENASVLLAGDIESAQEAALLARGAPLKSDVLLVPHHGSRTSSTPAFIDAVSPRVAVVQAAYRSRFGHPAPDVVARYAARGVHLVRSDRCGAWTLPAAFPAVPARCERQVARRYWHHGASAPPVPSASWSGDCKPPDHAAQEPSKCPSMSR